MMHNMPMHPSLGPHEYKELSLMLANKKPLALFYTDSEMPEEFTPHLASGRLHCTQFARQFMFKDEPHEIVYSIISHAPNTPNVQRLIEVIKMTFTVGFSVPLEREIGQLLGYDDADIEYYIQRLSRSI
ncbi:hypothetical protein [Acinetobacter boissieri]|uniref:Uncharacterized protein n=1 Tax=Acinetobacter boissieri TaxID=1219383 RepID=A0A1G6HZC5_9GAMM|nr:hypothetical protein [Acinetobacter boissieri]SDB98826.1 hypothetical protein SAMN05421733_10793 [Acinetobacter boissieri]